MEHPRPHEARAAARRSNPTPTPTPTPTLHLHLRRTRPRSRPTSTGAPGRRPQHPSRRACAPSPGGKGLIVGLMQGLIGRVRSLNEVGYPVAKCDL